jgi:hypothetical protein
MMSASGRRKTLSRSRRLTMPTSFPSSSTTGSLLIRCVFISRAAAGMVASGPMVTAGAVISVPAVRLTYRCLRNSQRRPAELAIRARLLVSSSAASRSASLTTPTTSRPIFSTGIPLIRCSASSRSISWYGVIRSTVTTEVVITSLTLRAHRR